jgi:hypothetical protein
MVRLSWRVYVLLADFHVTSAQAPMSLKIFFSRRHFIPSMSK